VVEHLLSICKTLGSSLCIKTTKRKKEAMKTMYVKTEGKADTFALRMDQVSNKM
jgi:hypothetical protein